MSSVSFAFREVVKPQREATAFDLWSGTKKRTLSNYGADERGLAYWFAAGVARYTVRVTRTD
jgi:hypothetical protein